jgi:methyl-accepting chemotaxis protein
MSIKIIKQRDFYSLKNQIESYKSDIDGAISIVNDIEKGNFEVKYESIKTQSKNSILIHSLIQMRDRMHKVKQEEQERIWVNEGLAKFGDILRKNDTSIADFTQSIISQLVNYIGATLGAIYLVEKGDDGENYLNLASSYAYKRKKHHSQQIMIGEGLVGQCILEKEPILLTDVPSDFINITSGLGEALPRCVFIIPLLTDEEVFGVIELASFKEYKKYQQDFLIRISENLAGVIKNIRTNEHTKKLLLASEQMTQKLTQQEEEMRQNMEELQATQEELLRKDKENHDTIIELRAEYDATLEEIKNRENHLQKIKTELLEKLTSNNALIDVAGRQRMLSQKIGFYAEMILRGNTSGTILLEKAIQMHEESLISIKNGGLAPGYDQDMLPKADEKLLPTIEKVESVWNIYKKASNDILTLTKNGQEYINNLSQLKESVKIIEENGELLLKLNNELLIECSKINKERIIEMYK